MRVLAIDTALEACSALVLDTEADAVVAVESEPMVRGHAEALMPLIAHVMGKARIEFAAIDRVAVTVGPGSFTGLRVGIAAARGIALAANKPVVGVTTLETYAGPHIAADQNASVLAAIDARHAQVYLQVFAPGGHALAAPRIASIEVAAYSAPSGRCCIVGTAAEEVAAAWPAGAPAPIVIDARRAPDIEWVARLGAKVVDSGTPPRPLYLRAPDARPQDAARLARQ